MAAKIRTTINDPRIRDASLPELQASLMFLTDEDENFFKRWDYMLGLLWTEEDIKRFAESEEKQGNSGPISAKSGPKAIRVPLSFLIRPELVDHLKKLDTSSEFGLEMQHVDKDALSLSNVSKDQFLKAMGSAASKAPREDDEYNIGTYDPDPTSFRGIKRNK